MATLFAGVLFLVFGLWAFLDARSFYEQLAEFPPYNRHLVHDIGAFQIAIGTALVLATMWSDSVAAALGAARWGASSMPRPTCGIATWAARTPTRGCSASWP